jgi:predicted O-methyltransferase YrrM
MLRALPRLSRRPDSGARALTRALWTTALGRFPPEERGWIERIEMRRRVLPSAVGARTPEDLGVIDLASAVEWMSVPPVLGQLLMRLVRELEPRRCLELGTGFGISAAYQGAALELSGAGRLITIDIAPQWAALAREGFSELGLDRVETRVGDPREALESALADCAPVDYAFVDSDHREAATLEVLEAMLPGLSDPALVVFDDVGLASPEMTRAWRRIGEHPRVSRAVRFARMGAAVVTSGRR